jgi:hypothetical protein
MEQRNGHPMNTVNGPHPRETAVDVMRAGLPVRDSVICRPGSVGDVPLQLFTRLTDQAIGPKTAEHRREPAGGESRRDAPPGSRFHTPGIRPLPPGRISALGGT